MKKDKWKGDIIFIKNRRPKSNANILLINKSEPLAEKLIERPSYCYASTKMKTAKNFVLGKTFEINSLITDDFVIS